MTCHEAMVAAAVAAGSATGAAYAVGLGRTYLVHRIVEVDDRQLRYRREKQVVRLELSLDRLLQAAHLARQLAKSGRRQKTREGLAKC